MKSLFNIIADYFDLTSSEKRGTIIVIFILIGLLILPSYLPYIIPVKPITVRLITSPTKDSSQLTNKAKEYHDNPQIQTIPNRSFFKFNPNTLNEAGFVRLGLQKFIARNIIKYRSKGGVFHQAEDFRKIYGITHDTYETLRPYIDLPIDNKHIDGSHYESKTTNSITIRSIEINSADSSQLVALKGIGPVYASRIIKYRKALGGFYLIDQLSEIYGFDSSYRALKSSFTVEASKLTKININTATYDQLKKHPYIHGKLAGILLNYRRQHGDFKSVDDLKKVYAINDVTIEKLRPYLTGFTEN